MWHTWGRGLPPASPSIPRTIYLGAVKYQILLLTLRASRIFRSSFQDALVLEGMIGNLTAAGQTIPRTVKTENSLLSWQQPYNVFWDDLLPCSGTGTPLKVGMRVGSRKHRVARAGREEQVRLD